VTDFRNKLERADRLAMLAYIVFILAVLGSAVSLFVWGLGKIR
jgi:hypothetical protein